MNDTCQCGHVRDEHNQQGDDVRYPSSRKCLICECIHFEEAEDEEENEGE